MGKNKNDNRYDLDNDFVVDNWDVGSDEYYEDGEVATCTDVLAFCFTRSCGSWLKLLLHLVLFAGLLYAYFFAITLLGSGSEVLGGCQVGSILKNTTNPVSCVLVGIIATCICQSSTVTNVVIGSLVGNVLTVQQGIYIAMGANVGNTITNSVLVFAYSLDKSELERAVAGVSVNDFYYFYALVVFVPIEAVSGFLFHLASTIVPDSLGESFKWTGFTGALITPITDLIIMGNKVSYKEQVALFASVSTSTSLYKYLNSMLLY